MIAHWFKYYYITCPVKYFKNVPSHYTRNKQ